MKTFSIALIATLATMNLFAQEPQPAGEPQKQDAAEQVELTQPDGIALKGGKVYLTENGKTSVITEEVWTKRGMQVTPAGTIIFASGEKAVLREGDFVTMDGAVARPIPLDGINSEVAYNKK
jgi:hypothetical protein